MRKTIRKIAISVGAWLLEYSFNWVDTNKDGKVDKQELAVAYQKLDKVLQKFIAKLKKK